MNKKNKCIMILTILLSLMMVGNTVVAINVEKDKDVYNNDIKSNVNPGENTFFMEIPNDGKFEGTPAVWAMTSETNGYNYEDTGKKIDWAANGFDGIYSHFRTDQDLSDDTPDEGAWCVAAAQEGPFNPFAGDEVFEGWVKIRCPVYVPEYYTELEGFEITDAKLSFDYRFGTDDFTVKNKDEYVNFIPSVEDVHGNNRKDFLFNKKWSPDTFYVNSKDWIYDPNPNDADCYNDKEISTLEDGTSLASWLNDYSYLSVFQLEFMVDVKLIGESSLGLERFKFWLDDVKIKCKFTADPCMRLSKNKIKVTRGTHDVGDTISRTVKVINDGYGSFQWNIPSIDYLGEGLSPYNLKVNGFLSENYQSGSINGFCEGHEDSCPLDISYTIGSPNMVHKWEIEVYSTTTDQTETLKVIIETPIKAKSQSISNSNLFLQRILSLGQFSFLSEILNRPLFSNLEIK